MLFLHGIGGSGRYWQPLAEVSRGYAGVAPDLLGFGRSPWPADSTYDVDAHLDALLAVAPPRSVVVAHSTGAVLAVALAARHPGRVEKLLLIGAPLYEDLAQARREVRRLGPLARVTASGEVAGRAAMVMLHGLVRPVSRLLPLGLPEPVVEDFWRHSWTSYSRTLRNVVIGYPAVPLLGTLTMPCTLLYGTDDTTAYRPPTHRLQQLNPRLRVLEAPGGHHIAVRDPAVVAEALGSVLATPPTV
ncbi:MAG: alpha/beta hydrolase [Mycobacteriales bacterium]